MLSPNDTDTREPRHVILPDPTRVACLVMPMDEVKAAGRPLWLLAQAKRANPRDVCMGCRAVLGL